MSLFALFSEVRILGDMAFTLKPIDHQNRERGTVAACDMPARGQLTNAHKKKPLTATLAMVKIKTWIDLQFGPWPNFMALLTANVLRQLCSSSV